MKGSQAEERPANKRFSGTKEIFLSNFIRLYQALDSDGQKVKLDLYEGMSHVFQAFMPDTPESKMALGKVDAFLKQHLGK